MSSDNKVLVVIVVGFLLFIAGTGVSVVLQRAERTAWLTQCMKEHPVVECERGLDALRR